MTEPRDPGVHLVRDERRSALTDALLAHLVAAGGGQVGRGVLADLVPRRHRARRPLPGVRRAWTWESADRADVRWWPQGVTTSYDASPAGPAAGAGVRETVAVSWYAKHRPGDPEGGLGVRVSLLDPQARRYRHVLLVVPAGTPQAPTTRPLLAHAGGLAWVGDHLHVAATSKGFWTARLADLVRLPDTALADHAGHRYVLPLRLAHPARTAEGVEPLRYSFLGVDHRTSPAGLLVGEYGRGRQTHRLARYDLDATTGLPVLDDDGTARPHLEQGVPGMQGAVLTDHGWVVTVSRGPWAPGSIWTGAGGALRQHRWAVPMGPEDLSHRADRDEVWSVTEHPRRRWVVTVDLARLRRS